MIMQFSDPFEACGALGMRVELNRHPSGTGYSSNRGFAVRPESGSAITRLRAERAVMKAA